MVKMSEVKIIKKTAGRRIIDRKCVNMDGKACGNEGTAACSRCTVYAGIPRNKQEKQLMYR
jgi:ribosomal protein L13